MIKIREYTKKDLPQMIKLFRDTVHTINAEDYSPAQLAAWAPRDIDQESWQKRLEANYALVAEKNGMIVGFGDLTSNGHIHTLYVHKDCQRQRIGTNILEGLIERARRLGIEVATTDASITARRFFEEHGFEVVKKQTFPYRGVEMTNYHMRRVLTPLFKLATERLILRDFFLTDFLDVHEYASDPEVVRFMEWGPNSAQDTERFLKAAVASQRQKPRHVFELAIVRKPDKLIGACSIRVTDQADKQAVIGYCLNRKYWGRGYATEAARALIKFGFSGLKMHKITATCDVENKASARVLEKSGMRREGLLRDHSLRNGRWRSSYLYGILETD